MKTEVMIGIIFSDKKEKQIEGYERETGKYSEEIFTANRKMKMNYILQYTQWKHTFKPA